MSIMRALKNVGIGYLQGTTDIMAQKAAQKREDEKLAAERAFEEKLQKDRIKQNLLANIEIEREKNRIKSDLDEEKRLKFVNGKKDELGQQGWNTQFLDIMELQGHLNSEAAWNTWFDRHDRFFQNNKYGLDWHVNAEFQNKDGVMTSFQPAYIEHYYSVLDGKTPFNTNDVLKNYNNISDNVAKSQTDGVAPDTTTQTNTDVQPDITTQTDTNVQSDGPQPTKVFPIGTADGTAQPQPDTTETVTTTEEDVKPFAGSTSYLSGAIAKQLPNELFITSLDDANWQYTRFPKVLEPGEMIKLTLTPDGYKSERVKIGDTFQDLQSRVEGREGEIVSAIYNNKGLFNTFGDMGQFMDGGQLTSEAVKSYFAQNQEKQALFSKLYEYSMSLDKIYQSSQTMAKGSQGIVQDALEIMAAVEPSAVQPIIDKVSAIEASNSTEAEIAKGIEVLEGLNKVRDILMSNIPREIRNKPQGKALTAMLQEKAFVEFKVNYARGFDDYDKAIKFVNAIIMDKVKGAAGNQGAFWQTKAMETAIRADQETVLGQVDPGADTRFVESPKTKDDIPPVKFDFTGIPERTIKSGGGIAANPEYDEYFNNFTQEKFDSFDKEFEDLKAKEPKKRIPNPPKIVGDKEIKMSGTRINPEWSEWNESLKPYRDLYQKLLNYEIQNKDKIKYTTQKTK
tara:strand:+ start:1760 stop:3796 length:2037 start_codon:yes stop_codon:yes gene_type:complete